MRFFLEPITKAEAEEISRWRYPKPYAAYDGDPRSVPSLLDPRFAYHAVRDETAEVVGYFCFGPDARVPAGRRLGLYDDDALDVGLGMKPGLTSLGLGLGFVDAGLRFAAHAFSPSAFRLTVAASNLRAVKVYERAGFETVKTFGDGGPQWLLMRRPV